MGSSPIFLLFNLRKINLSLISQFEKCHHCLLSRECEEDEGDWINKFPGNSAMFFP